MGLLLFPGLKTRGTVSDERCDSGQLCVRFSLLKVYVTVNCMYFVLGVTQMHAYVSHYACVGVTMNSFGCELAVCVCVSVSVSVRACVRACVCVCVPAPVWWSVGVQMDTPFGRPSAGHVMVHKPQD